MKKKVTIILACLFIAMSLGACSGDNAAEEATLYPLSFTSSLEDSVTEIPVTCYSTSASENGLVGNVYSVTGYVTESLTEEESSISAPMFSVENDNGVAWFCIAAVSYLAGDNETYLEAFGSAMDSTMDYTAPEVGEYVTVYGIYTRLSDIFEAPTLYFGIDEFLYGIVNDSESNISTTFYDLSFEYPSSATYTVDSENMATILYDDSIIYITHLDISGIGDQASTYDEFALDYYIDALEGYDITYHESVTFGGLEGIGAVGIVDTDGAEQVGTWISVLYDTECYVVIYLAEADSDTSIFEDFLNSASFI